MSEHKIPIPSMLYNAAVGGHVTNSQQIIDEVLNKEQSVLNKEQSVLNKEQSDFNVKQSALNVEQQKLNKGILEEKEYISGSNNGMGRVVLRKNLVNNVNTLTQNMINKSNTIYVIQYDFILSKNITIPENCVLNFDGGSIGGAYTLTGTNTQIKAQNVAIFNNGIIIAGTWICPYITSYWFNDVTSNNRIKQVFNLSNDVIQNEISIEESEYNVSASIEGECIIPLKSNTLVNLIGTIKVASNVLNSYDLFGVFNAKNVAIKGKGTVQGDKEAYLGTTYTGGTGISIKGSLNVIINGITCKDFWCDGIYIGGWKGLNKDIVIFNVVINNVGRTGIAITWAENVIISNCRISNIEGQLTEFGIDIEANKSCFVYNVTIDNVLFDTKNGVQLLGGDADHSIAVKNILVSQCRFINNRIPFRFRRPDNVTIENCDITINQSIQGYSEENLNIILCSEAINAVIRNNTIKCTSEAGYLFDVLNCGENLLIEHNVINTVGNLLTGKYSTPKFIRNNISTSMWILCESWTLNPYFYENSITSPCSTILRGKNFHIEKNTITCTGDTVADLIWMDDSNGNVLYNTIHCAVPMKNNKTIILSRGNNQQVIGNKIIIDDITNAAGAGIRFQGSNSLGGYNTITAGLESILYKWSGAFINIGTNELKSGNTESRPTNYVYVGFQYFDTTLGKPIYWNGTTWIDATGTTV